MWTIRRKPGRVSQEKGGSGKCAVFISWNSTGIRVEGVGETVIQKERESGL